jgi:dynein heavy chain
MDQLFAVGGLRHLMFYYQDVEGAEAGIDIWHDIT